jgi:hypothetical protein
MNTVKLSDIRAARKESKSKKPGFSDNTIFINISEDYKLRIQGYQKINSVNI